MAVKGVSNERINRNITIFERSVTIFFIKWMGKVEKRVKVYYIEEIYYCFFVFLFFVLVLRTVLVLTLDSEPRTLYV